MEPAKHWMTGDPVSIDPSASALEALDLMVDRGIRHLPVLDAARRVVGMLSLDDLRAALPFPVGLRESLGPDERSAAREYAVGDIMTHAPETLRPDDSLEQAAERMADDRIGCLPIVDEHGRLTGILSETDVLRAFATRLWTQRVAASRVVGREGDLDALVEGLTRERERLRTRLHQEIELERSLAAPPEPEDAADRGEDLRELATAQALEDLATRRLTALDHALDRAAQGLLGTCEHCGGRIPATRLRALPGTTSCVACARAREQRAAGASSAIPEPQRRK